MRRGREFDPVDRRAVGPLGRSDVGHQPVPRKEPLAAKEVEDVEHREVRWERHGQWGAKGNNPRPRGGGRGTRKDVKILFSMVVC